MKTNILLTGGSGFVGRNVYEGLKDIYTIYAPSRKELDLLDYRKVESYIKEHNINIIINAAIRGGDKVLDLTLRMFASLMRNIDRVDKIIHFGSGAEYAKTRDLIKIKESQWGEYIPEDDYGLAKYIIHHIIRNEKKIVNLRLFGVYGKYEGYKFKFISNAIAKNLFGIPITIKQDVIFDYLYIDDLIPIVEYFIRNNSKHSAYNITPDESISLSKIVDNINNISKNPVPVKLQHKKMNYQYTGSNKRLRKEIPSIKFISYREGIQLLYQYYSFILPTLEKNTLLQDVFFKKSKIKK